MRIAAMLRERITAGDLAPGQTTPSITRLCADHGVARQTAAHALRVLQDAGLVYRVPGLGYVPRPQRHPFPPAAHGDRFTATNWPGSFKESWALLNGRTGRYPLGPGDKERACGRGLASDAARSSRQAVLIFERAREGAANG